jgi:hypothetical protein
LQLCKSLLANAQKFACTCAKIACTFMLL